MLRRLLLLLIFIFNYLTLTSATCTDTEICRITTKAKTATELFRTCKLKNTHLILQNNEISIWNGGNIADVSSCVANVKILELHNVTSSDILNKNNPFRGFNNLQKLIINSNVNFSIDDKIFLNMPYLKELFISGSAIKKLQNGHLLGLTGLKKLTIKDSFLANIDAEAIARSIPVIEYINLSNNNITTLTNQTFGEKKSLKTLILNGNTIQYIELQAFHGLENLEELFIQLPNRAMARIWETTLEGRFDKLVLLKSLSLVDSKLTTHQIQEAFRNLKNLKELRLSGNVFGYSLHQSVLSSLGNIEYLDLSFCHLTCLNDRNFGVLSKLKTLLLNNNSLSYISQRAFEGLKSLNTLDLSGNKIEVIEKGSFCTLTNITTAVDADKNLLSNWGLSNKVYEGKSPTEPCPKDFIPGKLTFSNKCPEADSQRNLQTEQERSRNYLLIIVGICVGFLLITILSIVTYRAWSRRKNDQIKQEEDKEMDMQVMIPKAENGTSHGQGNGHGQMDEERSPVKPHRQQQRPLLPDKEPPRLNGDNTGPPKPQVSPKNPNIKMSAMATLPEDGDLEAKAVTTLAVV